MTAMARSRQRRLLLGLLLAFAVLATLGLAELALQSFPSLLPAWYRMRFPPNGVEFAAPGVLDRTPLTELPLPYGVDPYDGPPPHDLVDFGVAPADAAAADRAAVPRIVVPCDADGLPNLRRPEAAEVALVGDSFLVFGAQRSPPGLQARLEELLTPAILNVAISGIGPEHELFLLREAALPARPKLVVWFFFGGNDLVDAFMLRQMAAQGARTLGELFHDRRAPRFVLPSLVAELFRPAPRKRQAEPLPGLAPVATPDQPIWFYPETLRTMAAPAELVLGNGGWAAITESLATAQRLCADAGARFLVAYLPSKEQVMLPRVRADADLLRRFTLASAIALPHPDGADALLAALLANRNLVEETVRQRCAAAGIAFWSATGLIEAFVDAGKPAYYAADSHWRGEAQAAVAEGLVRELRRLGMWQR